MADAPGHAARDHGLIRGCGLARASCPAEVGLHGLRRRRLAAVASSEVQVRKRSSKVAARLQRGLWRLGYGCGRSLAREIVSSGKRSLKHCRNLHHCAARA